MNEKFWLDNPNDLIKQLNIIPNQKMSKNERLNTLTRLLIIISIILYIIGYTESIYILGIGIILIIIIYCNKDVENFKLEINEKQALEKNIRGFDPIYDSRPDVNINKPCWFNENQSLINAAYEVTPLIQFNHDDNSKRSYMNAKYELTPLNDTNGFKDIWRNEPEMNGSYNMIPEPLTVFPVEEITNGGQCNYIVRSNIDHLYISQAQNDLISTRAIAEQGYNKSIMDYRDSIMNEHIDRFVRERQHNCPDMKLGSLSAGSGGSI